MLNISKAQSKSFIQAKEFTLLNRVVSVKNANWLSSPGSQIQLTSAVATAESAIKLMASCVPPIKTGCGRP